MNRGHSIDIVGDTGPQNAHSEGHQYHQKLLCGVDLPSELIVYLPLVILLLLPLPELLAQGSARLFFLILWLDSALLCWLQGLNRELFRLLDLVHQLVKLLRLKPVHLEKLHCHLSLDELALQGLDSPFEGFNLVLLDWAKRRSKVRIVEIGLCFLARLSERFNRGARLFFIKRQDGGIRLNRLVQSVDVGLVSW